MPGYEELESRIIRSGICSMCGACISACPLYYLQLIDGKPLRPKKKAACKNCGTCYNSCYKTMDEKNAEGVGEFKRIVSAKWHKSNSCQDGGIVTGLLTYMLENGIIDGTVLTGGDVWKPVPSVAKNSRDINSCAKTKFGVSPVLMKLREAVVEHGSNRVCIVGTPCHIQAVRHLEGVRQDLSSAIKFSIGLFCSENIDHNCILEKMKYFSLNEEDVEKVNISNGELHIQTRDRSIKVPLSEFESSVPRHCHFCRDYAGELADVSIGSEGSPEGWSTVIVRTELGEKIFSQLERGSFIRILEFSESKLHYLINRSEIKRKRAKDTFLIP